jgi:hypothetical protein
LSKTAKETPASRYTLSKERHTALTSLPRSAPETATDATADPRHIPALTDDVGMDMSSLALVWPNTPETMGAITSGRTWCSTKSWEILFDVFAP